MKSWEYCGKPASRLEEGHEYGAPPAKLNIAGDKRARFEILVNCKNAVEAGEEGHVRFEDIIKV